MKANWNNIVVNFMKASTEDSAFSEACKRAGIPATRRQASKWLNQKGLAWEANKFHTTKILKLDF